MYNGSSLSQMKVTTEIAADGETTTTTHTLDFTYDASGSPVAVTYDGTVYYYALNLQGDVVAILNGSGSTVVSYTYDAWGYEKACTGTLSDTLGYYNPLRYRGYVYDTETESYYLQSRYYDPTLGRFINADAFASTGQGILGNNMFAYCRNNPVSRIDISGSADTPVEEEFDDDVEVTPPVPDAAGGGNGSGISAGTTGNGGSGPSGFSVTIGSSGIAAAPNPNNEKTERHHIVEQCQVRKSGFAKVDIQGNSNLIDLPYSMHRKISGYYSSKPDGQNLRIRDLLAEKTFNEQQMFGWDIIKLFWGELYGK